MLCQRCQQREAKVHLTTTDAGGEILQNQAAAMPNHLCQQCADDYFASRLAMNALRGLICLSDAYRAKLYDVLEVSHPEAFDNSDSDACDRGSQIMRTFLSEHFKKDNIETSGDAFEMLCCDFFCSHHFYTRVDEFKRRKG